MAAVGVNVVAALLLHRTTGGTRARLSRSVKPAARQRLFYRPTVKGDPMLAPGYGVTNKFGDITYSTRGSATDRAVALRHESVHSALSPKLIFLRNVRADLAMTAYQRSQFLRYLEEALAETYAQVSVRGIRGLPDGITFPLKGDGYALTIKGVTYGVFVLASD